MYEIESYWASQTHVKTGRARMFFVERRSRGCSYGWVCGERESTASDTVIYKSRENPYVEKLE